MAPPGAAPQGALTTPDGSRVSSWGPEPPNPVGLVCKPPSTAQGPEWEGVDAETPDFLLLFKQLWGEAQPSGNGTKVSFPGGDRPSAFQAVISQVPQGWDVNFRCGWNCFTSLANLPQHCNRINLQKFQTESGSEMERSPRVSPA